VNEQRRQFAARWQDFDAQVEVNRSHIREVSADMEGNLALAKAAQEHLKYTVEALDIYTGLKKKGLEHIGELLPVQTNAADIRGQIVQYEQTAEKDRRAIESYELMIVQQERDRQADIAKDLQTARATVAQLPDQIRGAEDIVARKTIRAPRDGRVVNQKFFTVGGVVQPGVPIMDIVPAEDDLIAEVRVDPADIDSIHPGTPAQVRLFAYSQATLPLIEGTVIMVGADNQVDPAVLQNAFIQSATQVQSQPIPASVGAYYLTRIVLSKAALDKWKRLAGVQLYPGMPVEAVIAKGERRAIDYLVQPIKDTFWGAFREK
jgi:HlyD family type I secretion membrane fusion protein